MPSKPSSRSVPTRTLTYPFPIMSRLSRTDRQPLFLSTHVLRSNTMAIWPLERDLVIGRRPYTLTKRRTEEEQGAPTPKNGTNGRHRRGRLNPGRFDQRWWRHTMSNRLLGVAIIVPLLTLASALSLSSADSVRDKVVHDGNRPSESLSDIVTPGADDGTLKQQSESMQLLRERRAAAPDTNEEPTVVHATNHSTATTSGRVLPNATQNAEDSSNAGGTTQVAPDKAPPGSTAGQHPDQLPSDSAKAPTDTGASDSPAGAQVAPQGGTTMTTSSETGSGSPTGGNDGSADDAAQPAEHASRDRTVSATTATGPATQFYIWMLVGAVFVGCGAVALLRALRKRRGYVRRRAKDGSGLLFTELTTTEPDPKVFSLLDEQSSAEAFATSVLRKCGVPAYGVAAYLDTLNERCLRDISQLHTLDDAAWRQLALPSAVEAALRAALRDLNEPSA